MLHAGNICYSEIILFAKHVSREQRLWAVNGNEGWAAQELVVLSDTIGCHGKRTLTLWVGLCATSALL